MRKFWKSPWTLALVPVFISFFLTLITDWVKQLEIFSTLKTLASKIWTWIQSLLNYELKVWWIVAIIAGCLFLLFLLNKYLNYRETKRITHPDFFNEYTSDTLQGVHWVWYWKKDTFGDPHLEGLTPVCPHCRTPLVQSYEHYMNHICPRCQYEHKKQFPEEIQIKTLIWDNVKRRMLEWASENVKEGEHR